MAAVALGTGEPRVGVAAIWKVGDGGWMASRVGALHNGLQRVNGN